ncbi:hypothetical protein [Desulfurococcus mucosus]|uniref:Uncharacterized protein n=1 Tax=Desulfurococcus mucosus (strain ATCC 35584 / DSM 2162 / JCM 9187 / O7/1) TaxID=765177 RepID=E8R900_DESM0|nr:hypothetical protein [Desulfurococcus mucosus]ADV64976.1 hypothetical protein Desmu_0668 [Desulfurococcus mucosus DSM 2162]
MRRLLHEELSKYFSRVVSEEQGPYVFFLVSGRDAEYVICVRKAEEYLYGKVVKADKVSGFNCREIEYEPHGLYVFAKEPGGLAEKILLKLGQYNL